MKVIRLEQHRLARARGAAVAVAIAANRYGLTDEQIKIAAYSAHCRVLNGASAAKAVADEKAAICQTSGQWMA